MKETDSDFTVAQEMAHLTCKLARACNEKEEYFASLFSLTPAEFRCLKLFTQKKSLSIKEINSELRLTPGRITHILTSLEEKKFVKRETFEGDKRNVIVTATNKSLPFIRNINHNHILLHNEILEKIDESKRDAVVDALSDLVEAMKEWSLEKSLEDTLV